MEKRICQMCSKDISEKKSNAKFCSDTCRAKFHDDRKSDEQQEQTLESENEILPDKTIGNLRGLVSEELEEEEEDSFQETENTKQNELPPIVQPAPIIQYIEETEKSETQAYLQLKSYQEKVLEMKKAGIALLNGYARRLKELSGNSSVLLYMTGIGLGSYIGDNSGKNKTEKTRNIVIGSGMGLLGAYLLQNLTSPSAKQLKAEIDGIKSQILKAESDLRKVYQLEYKLKDLIAQTPQFNIKTVRRPVLLEPKPFRPELPSRNKANEIKPPTGSLFGDLNSFKTVLPQKTENPIKPTESKPIVIKPQVPDIPVKKEEPKALTFGTSKIMSAKDLANLNYQSLDFKGEWLHLFGKPSVNFHCVIHGMPGEGKSTFAIQFAKYLAENNGRVLYVSGEEGYSKTMKDKIFNNNAHIDDLYLADMNTAEDIIAEVNPSTFNFIFIDSLDNMKIDADKMKIIRLKYPNTGLITISQSTKDGKMRGSLEIVHDADISVVVENGKATTTKNRFEEKFREYDIFKTNKLNHDDFSSGLRGIIE